MTELTKDTTSTELTGSETIITNGYTVTLSDSSLENSTILGGGTLKLAVDSAVAGIEGTTIIDLGPHSFEVGGDNSSNPNYTNIITGSGLFTKTGVGTYSLDTSDHSGAIDIRMGTIILTAGTHLSSVSITNTPGANLQICCDPSHSVTIDSMIGGGQGLVPLVILQGSVTIGNADEFEGSIYLHSGSSLTYTKHSKTPTITTQGIVDL